MNCLVTSPFYSIFVSTKTKGIVSMKKAILLLLAVMTLMPAMAQEESTTKKAKKTISEKTSKFWKDAKESVNSTADIIKDELGIKGSSRDSVRSMYMPIYTRNKYNEGDMYKLIQACRDDFSAKYPNCEIVSSVIPQKEWKTYTLTEGDNTVGYCQQLYCYVLAKDGDDGYINAEYLYEREKSVGGDYANREGFWPSQPQVDVIPAQDYEIIK